MKLNKDGKQRAGLCPGVLLLTVGHVRAEQACPGLCDLSDLSVPSGFCPGKKYLKLDSTKTKQNIKELKGIILTKVVINEVNRV